MKNNLTLIALCSLMCVSTYAHAGDCKPVSSTCVDTTPSKLFGGKEFTLEQAGGCWKYDDVYNCLKDDALDFCSGIASVPGCWQSSVRCTERNMEGGCETEVRQYRCDDSSSPPPANTLSLDRTHTLVNSTIDPSSCRPTNPPKDCEPAKKVCVELAPATQECLKWGYEYVCKSLEYLSTCASLRQQDCTQIDKNCIDTNDDGKCSVYSYTYKCVTEKGEVKTELDCSAQQACIGDNCWDVKSPDDKDFANAVAGIEIGRQLGVYGRDEHQEFFAGEASTCTEGYAGLKSCCDSSPGAKSNHSVMNEAVSGGVKAVGSAAINHGTKWAFDAAFGGGKDFMVQGFDAIAAASNGISPTQLSTSFQMYGIGYGSAGAGAGALGTTTYPIGQTGFYFDPMSLAITLAIMVIMDLMSCEPEEQMLALQKGQNLTHYIGSYCSKKVLGSCVEKTESYCSFNSVLAKVINVEGRQQINKSWGTAKKPDCSGFTIQQIQQLDFSEMDFTEFTKDVIKQMPEFNSNDTAIIRDKINGSFQNDPKPMK